MFEQYVDGTKAIRAGEELDLARLEPFLREHLPQADGPLSIEQFPAGHSNLTYLVRLGTHEYVLRRPPFGSKVKTAHDMGREFRVLKHLHAYYAPAPEPLCHTDDLDIIGAPFYVMQRIPGVILRRDPPPGLDITPEIARRLGESFIDNLANLHAVDYAAIGLADLGKPEGYIERQVSGWIKRYGGSQTDEIAEVDRVASWLTENLPEQGSASLIHNDYKLDNVLLDTHDITKIAGVLDWEMSTIGEPLSDLATTVSYWIEEGDTPELQLIRWGPTSVPGSLTRQQLVDRYAERTGRDTSNIVYYFVLALFKTAVIAQQIYYRYHQGLTKDARFAFFIEATKILVRAADAAKDRGTL